MQVTVDPDIELIKIISSSTWIKSPLLRPSELLVFELASLMVKDKVDDVSAFEILPLNPSTIEMCLDPTFSLERLVSLIWEFNPAL